MKCNMGDGNSSPAPSLIDNGLVIKDDNNNEWTWIPVEASVLSGMYATSNEGVQKEKATLTNKNWYELYKKCTTLNASYKVESKMIWGITQIVPEMQQ